MTNLEKFELIKNRITECVVLLDVGDGHYHHDVFSKYPFDPAKWKMSKSIPTINTLHLKYQELIKLDYRKKRKKEYDKRGLNFNKFIEALIEDDVSAIAKFRSDRQVVKGMFPKPS